MLLLAEETIVKMDALVVDRVRWRPRRSVGRDYTRKLHAFAIPRAQPTRRLSTLQNHRVGYTCLARVQLPAEAERSLLLCITA